MNVQAIIDKIMTDTSLTSLIAWPWMSALSTSCQNRKP